MKETGFSVQEQRQLKLCYYGNWLCKVNQTCCFIFSIIQSVSTNYKRFTVCQILNSGWILVYCSGLSTITNFMCIIAHNVQTCFRQKGSIHDNHSIVWNWNIITIILDIIWSYFWVVWKWVFKQGAYSWHFKSTEKQTIQHIWK